ncbi:uncharacterized protein LOC127789243 isoform X1 [Diospyros lotus]|uniref:uncharacterized protein LOC127789243 isoform X1 n=1 Tax=Diospyros lotus TaxID=55363 RepID=UPI0022503FF6|nr:uncharacterized protein LOC127789243 isoform X1 [Diospyros lotus]
MAAASLPSCKIYIVADPSRSLSLDFVFGAVSRRDSQFDELIDIVDSLTSKLRRGKNPRERKSARPVEASKSKAAAAAATTGDQTKEEEKNSSNPAGMILQGENDHNLLVQTVTRHLEDLRDDSP